MEEPVDERQYEARGHEKERQDGDVAKPRALGGHAGHAVTDEAFIGQRRFVASTSPGWWAPLLVRRGAPSRDPASRRSRA